MSYYINKKTLEVLETENIDLYKVVKSDYILYPYDEYQPEKYYLDDFQHIDHIFNIDRSVRESITDLDCWYESLIGKHPQYDYIAFSYYEYEDMDDSYMERIPQLKAYGCFRPSAERALLWYKEQKADVEREKERSKKYLEDNIKDLTKRLDEAKLHLEELTK